MSYPYPPPPSYPYPPPPPGYPSYPPYPYPQQRGIGEALYDDASSLGRFWSYIIFGFIIFIAVIMLFAGISKSMSNSVYTENVLATVNNTNCSPVKSPPSSSSTESHIINYKCNVGVKYEVDGKSYEIPSVIVQDQNIINQGQKIPLYYNPKNPNDVSTISRSQEKQSGAGLILASIIMIAFASLFLWMVHKFKFLAAVQGGSFIRNIIR